MQKMLVLLTAIGGTFEDWPSRGKWGRVWVGASPVAVFNRGLPWRAAGISWSASMPIETATHIWLDERGVAWIDRTNIKVIEVVMDNCSGAISPQRLRTLPQAEKLLCAGDWTYDDTLSAESHRSGGNGNPGRWRSKTWYGLQVKPAGVGSPGQDEVVS